MWKERKSSRTRDKAIEKSILVRNVVSLDPDAFISQNGNYIEFSVTSTVNGQASAAFVDGNGQPLLTWNFRIREGAGRYRIRISSDSLWWSGLCRGFTLSLPDPQEFIAYEYRILKGDVASNSFNLRHCVKLEGRLVYMKNESSIKSKEYGSLLKRDYFLLFVLGGDSSCKERI